jgi:hypothetical protein
MTEFAPEPGEGHGSGGGIGINSESATVSVEGAPPAGVAGMEGSGGGVMGGLLGGIGVTNSGTVSSNNAPMAGAPVVKAASPRFNRLETFGPTYEDSAVASTAPNTNTSSFDDYFEYKLADPITIRKNESALVPILQTKIEAERVTLWSPSEPQALRALWIKNTSDVTLDHGSFSILDDGRFGGEGHLEVIHPNERRLLSYAADQAVRVTTEHEHNERRLNQVTVSKGILIQRTIEVADRDYVVHNAAPDARKIVTEYPFHQGWQLDSEVKPVETTSTAYRFYVQAAPAETVRLHIGERHTIAQRYELGTMAESNLDYLLRTEGGDATQLRAKLAPIFDAKRQLAGIDAQINAKQAAIDEVSNDQKRLRDNLTALKGSAEERALVRRYTDELNQQEDKLAALRKDQESLRQQRTAAEADLSTRIQSLEFDEKIG